MGNLTNNIPKQPALSLPKGWQLKKLGEVCTYSKGKKPAVLKETKTKECSVPYINIKAFEKGIISEYTNGEKCNICSDDDLLMVWDGARCGLIGKAKNGAVGSTLMKILPKENIHKEYLYHFINSKFWTLNTKPKGVGIPHIEPTLLWNFELIVPLLSEQQAIVAKIEELLSELENGKQQLLTAQQQLSIYRKALIMDGVTGKLTSKWRENNPNADSSEKTFQKIQKQLDKVYEKACEEAVSNGKRKPKDQRKNKKTINVEADLPKLQSNWNYYRLEDITYLVTDGTHFTPKYQDSGVKFLSVKNVRPFYFREENVKYISEEEHKSLIQRCNPQKNDILYTKVGATFGYAARINMDYDFSIFVSLCLIKPVSECFSSKFLEILMNSELVFKQARKRVSGSGVPDLHLIEIRDFKIPLPSLEEQQLIVSELESKLTVCDKIEETISQSLQQAETLRQSILKKAFEGKLVTAVAEQREAKVIPLYKPKNEYFYQMQLLGIVAKASKQKQIEHGEMTLAKYTYLMDKVYDIPTYYEYNRWHLGPYPPIIKKAINNKQYFKKSGNYIEVLNEKTLFKSTNPYTEKIQSAVNDLTDIFSKYTAKERSHKTELLATVCKVIEDIQSPDLKAIRQSMAEWNIDLKGEKHKTKAEKFNESETEKCLAFIAEKGWDKKLIK